MGLRSSITDERVWKLGWFMEGLRRVALPQIALEQFAAGVLGQAVGEDYPLG